MLPRLPNGYIELIKKRLNWLKKIKQKLQWSEFGTNGTAILTIILFWIVEFRNKFFLMFVSKKYWEIFLVLFWLWVNSKTIKITGFYNNAHLLDLLRFDVSSTEIQYLKRKHIPMKIWYFKCFICRDSSDEPRAFPGLYKKFCLSIIFFRFPLNKFLQSEIKQQWFSFQKITRIIVIADQKVTSSICISAVFCSTLVCVSD